MHSDSHEIYRFTLNRLGDSLGLDLEPDEHRMLTVTLAEGAVCTLEHPVPTGPVCFHAPLFRLPPAGRMAALEAALQINLFSSPVPTSWLALDAETDEVRICGEIPLAEFDPERVTALFTAIAAAIPNLRAALSASPAAAAMPEPGSEDYQQFMRV